MWYRKEIMSGFIKMTLRRRIPAVVLTALAVSTGGPGSARAASKDFYFPQVRIEIAVAADGSFVVDEYRTFEFRGEFRWATYGLSTRTDRGGYRQDVSIDDFSVADGNEARLPAVVTRTTDRVEARWDFQARNERKTFHIRYRVSGGVLRHADACELYWQAIGDGWDKPTEAAVATVRLPAPAAEIKDLLVFGHGPLSGVARIEDARTASFRATHLAARQILEIRFLWPLGLTDGGTSDGRTLASIRAEEARFVQDTIERNRRRLETEARKTDREHFWIRLWLLGLLVLPLLWLPFFLRVWRRAGRDYRFDDIPPYVHEPPSDLSPALVETLLREGEAPTARAYTATIFDLARRGFIEIEDVRVEKHGLFGPKTSVDTNLTLRKDLSDGGPLEPFERAVLEVLFVDAAGGEATKGASLGLGALQNYLKKHVAEFQPWFQTWTKDVKAEGRARGFIEAESLRLRNIYLAVTVPLALLTLNVVMIVLAAVLIPKMKRRTRPWARENEMWKGLKRFLDDFSEFKETPSEAYKLWESYLVYGIVFGNAKRILKSLSIVLRDERAATPVWYAGFGHSAFLQSGGFESMISHIDSLSASITSAAHYSSGSGGGFRRREGAAAGGGGGSAG